MFQKLNVIYFQLRVTVVCPGQVRPVLFTAAGGWREERLTRSDPAHLANIPGDRTMAPLYSNYNFCVTLLLLSAKILPAICTLFACQTL